MLFQKQGFPEESELVLCTTTAVQPNSVFVRLDEYGKSGMIHISEIAPGRIRNIRDFVKEGKKIVCVVLRINLERGHIDLSLRRVNEGQRKKKIEAIKQLQKAEKIVEFVATGKKIETKKLFTEIMDKIKDDYPDLVAFFNAVVMQGVKISDYGISHADSLDEIVRQRIKPPEIEIEGEFTVQTHAENGVSLIRKAFDGIDDRLSTCYLGAGRYQISLKASDYKEAEDILNPARDKVIANLERSGAKAEFRRITKKK